MPILDISFNDKEEKLAFEAGKSLKQLLDTTIFRVRSGCRGIGACGLCKVRIISGNQPKPTMAEELHIDEGDLNSGIRLACQQYPTEDMRVEVVACAPLSGWHSEVMDDYGCKFALNEQDGYRLAIDVGTTHLGIAVMDDEGSLISNRRGTNPQLFVGADVLSRIVSAVNSKDTAELLWNMVVSALSQGIKDITSREGVGHCKIRSCDIVGNTAMISLLCRHNFHLLLEPASWMLLIQTNIDEENAAKLLSMLGVGSLRIWPAFAGFVGSDVGAGVLHTRLIRHEKPSMLIDFGTNSEIALWDGKKLWLTSAAGGPAFEASGVGCAIPAGRGAIFRVSKSGDDWNFETIGDVKPEGLCGSALVDLIAWLVASKEVSTLGVFTDLPDQVWRLPIDGTQFYISKRDIDLFARAKAAIPVGIVALCKAAGISIDDIDMLYIGGDFGNYLDIARAMEIGLVPQMPKSRVQTLGSTALMGCIDLALSDEAKEEFWAAQKVYSVINLASYDYFDEVYMQNLYLRPMSYGN